MACIYNLSHVLSPGYVWHATLLQIWFVSDTAQNLTKLPTRKLLKWPTRHCCPTVALHTTACIYEHCFPIATNIHLAWKGFSINCHISWQLDHWRRTTHGNYNSIALHGLQDAKWSPWLGQDTAIGHTLQWIRVYFGINEIWATPAWKHILVTAELVGSELLNPHSQTYRCSSCKYDAGLIRFIRGIQKHNFISFFHHCSNSQFTNPPLNLKSSNNVDGPQDT